MRFGNDAVEHVPPWPPGAVSTNGQGGTLQSVEYRQSGIIFDLSPQVFRDAERLSLSSR